MFKDFLNQKEFPRTFWTLMGATLIDQIGRFLLLPFFALYITDHFGVSMTQVGQLFLIWAVFGTIGGFVGGALADRFGRKSMIIFGLIFSAGTMLFIGSAQDVRLVFGLAALVGFLSDIGGPAQAAMVADILPEHRRTEGFGIWRVVVNIAAVIGPATGALLVLQFKDLPSPYFSLFVTDAITSLITAAIVFLVIPETKPEKRTGEEQETLAQTVLGYGRVLRDRVYMVFLLISILGVMVYAQLNTTMPVYLRDVAGIPPEGYGSLLSLNAALVVLLQFWITRRMKGYPPMILMAFGVFLYAVGFGMFGFGSTLAYFALATVILTFGEMISAPTGQALAARFAPEDMRGRYLAMFSFSWAFPFAFAPLLGGMIMDNFNPHWMWYAAGLVGLAGTVGYLILQITVGARMGKTGDNNQIVSTAAAESSVP